MLFTKSFMAISSGASLINEIATFLSPSNRYVILPLFNDSSFVKIISILRLDTLFDNASS